VSERLVVRLFLAGKWRPGIVLDTRGDWWRVAYGTSREPSADVESMERGPDCRDGRNLDLTQTTWFHGANTALERPSQ